MIYTKVILAMVLALASTFATADMEYELGIYNTFYEGDSQGLKLRVGNTNWPVYTWMSREQVELRMLGQNLADAETWAFGIGAEHAWGEFTIFADAGYAIFDQDTNLTITDEIVYTELVNNHNASDSRPVPAADPTRPYMYGGQSARYHPDDARTMYELKNSFIGRLGAGYQLSKHVKMTVSYRFLTPTEHFELWDVPQREERGGGWWQESREKDLSAWELGIYATF